MMNRGLQRLILWTLMSPEVVEDTLQVSYFKRIHQNLFRCFGRGKAGFSPFQERQLLENSSASVLTVHPGQLRQDPKKTQLFQPDLAPTRQRYSRTTTSPQASPAPAPIY